MTSLDYAFLAILAVSALIGVLRGLIKEALSLLVWIAAAWLAARYGSEGGRLVADAVADQDLRLWSGRLLVFVVVLFAGSFLTWLVGYLVRRLPITGADRALGLCFGLARGVLLVSLLLVLLRLGGFDSEPWWQRSKLLPYAAAVTSILERAARSQLAGAPPALSRVTVSAGRPACGGFPSCAA